VRVCVRVFVCELGIERVRQRVRYRERVRVGERRRLEAASLCVCLSITRFCFSCPKALVEILSVFNFYSTIS
jgi:hypothetical protein